MRAERGALNKRGYWDIVRISSGVTLIKSRYVYKLKKDWKGKVVKWKSRLVILGFNQIEGLDNGETFAPLAKATTFRLMVALTKVLKMYLMLTVLSYMLTWMRTFGCNQHRTWISQAYTI